jgi:hypothetical protein
VGPDLFGIIESAKKKRGTTFRAKLWIFILCLALAFFFWMLVRLSKDYYYSRNYMVVYTGVPSNYRLVSASDSSLSIIIKVQGYDYFTEYFLRRKNEQLYVDLKDIRVKPAEEGLKGYLLTSDLRDDIASQMSFSTEVFATRPDTIYFVFRRINSSR